MQGGYRGFYSKNTIPLTSKVVNDIHKRGGTILGTSRGGHDTGKIVDSIQDRGINQVYYYILNKFPLLNGGIINLEFVISMCLTLVGYYHGMDFHCLGYDYRFILLEVMEHREERLRFMRYSDSNVVIIEYSSL